MSSTKLPITIVGAGISGLTLGQCLKQKGIPAIIYDRATSSPRYSYGIVLRSATYRPLLSVLRMDEATFRSRTAVESSQGDTGASPAVSTDSFRCHRGRLESILRQDLTIVWNKRLSNVELGSGAKQISAVFEDGENILTNSLIGCDGPHSVTRQSLSSNLNLQVLPYVVFNGKRYVSLSDYTDLISPYLGDEASMSLLKGDVLLRISLNEIDESKASISYTYSRPTRGRNDLLHRADRPTTGATDIPEEFFTELTELSELPPPFNKIFNVEDVRNDVLLHWLMRIVSPKMSEIRRLAESGVALIGDAAHATPILGGEGANVAIQDSIDIAEHISSEGTTNLQNFSEKRFESWKKAVEDSQQRIAAMHTTQSAHI